MTNSPTNESKVSLDSRLFSPGQIGAATFLGNAIAGGFLIAMNYFKMKESRRAWQTIWASVLFFALVFAIAMMLPRSVTNAMYIGQAFGFKYLAKSLQGKEFDSHIASGGKRSSHWKVFGIGTLGMIVTIIFLFVMVIALPDVFSPNVKVTETEIVYYEDGATREDAEKLGKALQKVKYFKGEKEEGEISVTVSRKYGEPTIIFPVNDGTWNDQEVVESYKFIGKELAPAIGGPPVHIKLCDILSIEKKDIVIEK